MLGQNGKVDTMNAKRFGLSLLLCSPLLAACQTGGVGMVGSPLWQITASEEDKVRVFVNRCASYGFKEKTAEMAQCVASERRAASDSAARRLDSFNRNTSLNSTTTTCSRLGNTINCNTW